MLTRDIIVQNDSTFIITITGGEQDQGLSLLDYTIKSFSINKD